MQVAKLLGRGVLGGVGITAGFDRLTHWTGPDVWCLAFGTACSCSSTLPDTLISPSEPHRCWVHASGKFRPSLASEPLSLLDAVAHVTVVLDSGLCVPSARHVSTRTLVAQPGAGDLDGAVRPVAQSDPAVCVVGLLPRLPAGRAPAGAAVAQTLHWNPPEALWNLIGGWQQRLPPSAWDGSCFAQIRQRKQAVCCGRWYHPRAIRDHSALDLSLYLLVLVIAVAYAIVLQLDTLNHHADELPESPSAVYVALARRRWIWVPPSNVALIVVLSLPRRRVPVPRSSCIEPSEPMPRGPTIP